MMLIAKNPKTISSRGVMAKANSTAATPRRARMRVKPAIDVRTRRIDDAATKRSVPVRPLRAAPACAFESSVFSFTIPKVVSSCRVFLHQVDPQRKTPLPSRHQVSFPNAPDNVQLTALDGVRRGLFATQRLHVPFNSPAKQGRGPINTVDHFGIGQD